MTWEPKNRNDEDDDDDDCGSHNGGHSDDESSSPVHHSKHQGGSLKKMKHSKIGKGNLSYYFRPIIRLNIIKRYKG